VAFYGSSYSGDDVRKRTIRRSNNISYGRIRKGLFNLRVTSGLPKLTSLSELTVVSLGYNQISNISPLTSLANLTSLDLRKNEITDISPLASLTNLTSLILGKNHITDISPLMSLARLEVISFEENPLNTESTNVHVPCLEKKGINIHR
jgi:Leucine-rich repeat (LRR) protein